MTEEEVRKWLESLWKELEELEIKKSYIQASVDLNIELSIQRRKIDDCKQTIRTLQRILGIDRTNPKGEINGILF